MHMLGCIGRIAKSQLQSSEHLSVWVFAFLGTTLTLLPYNFPEISRA